MSSFERILLFVHVVTTVLWVGGLHLQQLQAARIVKSGDAERIAAWADEVDRTTRRLYTPLAALVLVSGIWLTANMGIDMGESWISVGFLTWLVAIGLGAALAAPRARKVAAAIAVEGVGSPAAQEGIRRVLLVSRIELAVLLLAILAMTTKLFP